MSTRKRVLRLLSRPDAHVLTSAQISRELNVRLDSLSSLLRKMCTTAALERHSDFGPRGGYGYCINIRGRCCLDPDYCEGSCTCSICDPRIED